jgi:hypothetical protein
MTLYRIENNTKFNSLEIFFTGKPGQETRDALKALKFRWNPKKSCWYGFGDPEEVKKACDGVKVETTKKPATDDRQKELFNKFMNVISEVWTDPKMQEFNRKNTAYIVELKNGDLIAIDKPRIETSFCFGYGLYARATDEEMKAAADMEKYASTNQEYFLTENLKGIDEKIKDLRDTKYKAYTFIKYSGQPEQSKLKEYTLATLCYSPEYNPGYYANLKDLKEIDIEDREKIAQGFEIVRADFEKRLHTYLKKYGLSKLKTWTYLVD